MIDDLGNTTRWIYDERSNLLATVDATGRATQYHYDADGRVTAALDPLGHKTQFDYDADGNLVAVTNLKGYQATFAYDSAGRLTDSTTPEGVTSQITYRPDGQVATVTNPAGTTTYGYTAAGMLETITDPLNRTSRIVVDAAGQVTSTTDPLNRTTSYRYDPAGRLDVITDPAGNTIDYGYDNTGRVVTYTDQNGRTTTYNYDDRGLLTSTTDPLNRVDRIGYDLARRQTSTTNARGQIIGYGYDNANRLTTIDYPAGTPDVSYTYDDAGRPLTMVDGTGTTTYTYDTGGRLIQEDRSLADATLSYRYDMLNRRSELTLERNGGLTARNVYGYDGDGRLSVLTDSAGGDTTFAYDPAGRLAELTHPNGIVTAYAYDAASQVTGITNNRVAQATGALNLVSAWQYSYDLAGQRSASTRTVAGTGTFNQTYGYDQLGRLTSATSTDPQAPVGSNATWAYDPAGNRIRQTIAGAAVTTYTYDVADQLTSDGVRNYLYDADGNLTARRTALGGVNLATYTWDPANRITSQTVGGITTSYTYDGNSRRVTKTDTTGTNTYIYDGGDLLEEISTAITGGDAVETTAGGTVLNRITAAGQSYLHPDANANIGEVTDANGLTITRNAYSPWGNRTTIGSTATDPYLNRHGFAGATGVRDDSGGLIDMRNRMYDPSLGIFISRDPAESMTNDAYGYAGDNPVSAVDPYGLWPWDDWCINNPFASDGDPSCNSIAEQNAEGAQQVANVAGGLLNGITLGNADTVLGAVDAVTPFDNSVGRVRWNAPETALGNIGGMALLAPIAIGSPAAFGTYSNITARVDLAGELYSCAFTNCSPIELGTAVVSNLLNAGAARIGALAGDELGLYSNVFFTYLWGGASSTFGMFPTGGGSGSAK